MPSHWTYESVDKLTDLEQGDILRPTDNLRQLLRTVHPHFCADKYLAFMITTQSCDLVRRKSVPRAAYINLAVVRALSQVMPKIAAQVITPIAGQVFKSSGKGDIRRLLERILNQNEQTIGLFFLYPDGDAGIAEPAVTMLRVSVALRGEHYELLRQARAGRLSPEFRAKLGWLIGNLYARPATPDWSDTLNRKGRFEEFVQQYLGEIRWLDDEIIDAAQKQGIDIANEANERLEELRPPSPLDRAIAEVKSELDRIAPDFPDEMVKKLGNRLRNSGKFTKLFRKPT
jgi:hypothetical protein